MLTEGPSRQAGRHEAGALDPQRHPLPPSSKQLGPPDPTGPEAPDMSRLEEDLGQIEKQLLAWARPR